MVDLKDENYSPELIAEQQRALDALVNNLGRVIGTEHQSAWVQKATSLKNTVAGINIAQQSNYRLAYDADKVDAATSLVPDNTTKEAIGSALRGMQPVRQQKSFANAANQPPDQISR